VTPSDRYYAFGHTADEFCNWELQWKAVGLGLTDFGPIVDVDKATPPYGGSHLLMTSAPKVGVAATNVWMPVSDGFTPRTSTGQAVFAPVWQYMCFA
jgi:hypothetical protein